MAKKAPLVGPSLEGPSKEGPIVSIAMPQLSLRGMRFTPPEHEDERHFHYLYSNSREHPKVTGDLKGLARGKRFATAEWATEATKTPRNFPLCYTRGAPIHMSVLFKATGFKADASVKFTVEPRVDGKTGVLLPTEFSVSCGPKEGSPLALLTLGGALPDDRIGRMKLELEFQCLTPGVFFHNAAARVRSEHHVYVTHGVPLYPATGLQTTAEEGTLAGTPTRLKKLVQLFGSSKQHRVKSENDLKELYWEVHEGINNRTPPYFRGGHGEKLIVEAFPAFENLPVDEWPADKVLSVSDQWLMWLETKSEVGTIVVGGKKVARRRHWNDASCIGHAQLQKTMMATLGLPGQLAWVYPHTTHLPLDGKDWRNPKQNDPGDVVKFADSELFGVDQFDNTKRQFWIFDSVVPDRSGTLRPVALSAVVVLMHSNPKEGFENFEGCFRTPQGLFLTGGFPTSRNPAAFRKNRGFRSAAELLEWWVALKEDGKKRFLCWVSDTDKADGYTWFFDRFGAIHSDPEEIQKANAGLLWDP